MFRISSNFLFFHLLLHLLNENLSNGFAKYNFNSEELKTSHYSIRISGQPHFINPDQGNQITIKNKWGQPFECNLPYNEKEKESLRQNETEDHLSQNIVEILKSLNKSPCLLRTIGWWTYEICFGRYVRQYHDFQNGQISQDIVFLGIFDHDDFHWINSSIKNSYHRQYYANGSHCEITMSPRTTEVRFVCDPYSFVDSLTRVYESQSCEYICIVSTSKICSFPQLRPLEESKEIFCSPHLDSMETNDKNQKLHSSQTMDSKKSWIRSEKKSFKKSSLIETKVKELQNWISSASPISLSTRVELVSFVIGVLRRLKSVKFLGLRRYLRFRKRKRENIFLKHLLGITNLKIDRFTVILKALKRQIDSEESLKKLSIQIQDASQMEEIILNSSSEETETTMDESHEQLVILLENVVNEKIDRLTDESKGHRFQIQVWSSDESSSRFEVIEGEKIDGRKIETQRLVSIIANLILGSRENYKALQSQRLNDQNYKFNSKSSTVKKS